MGNMIGEWPHNSHEINKEERTSNHTEPNRAEPILSEPHRKPMPSPTWAVTHSAIVNHRVEALKNRMWNAATVANCCCALATWQLGKLQTDLGLGSRRRPAQSIVTSGVGFSSLFSPSWRCPVYDFISSRQVTSCASPSLSLSFSRVFAISHASLPPNQLVKRRTRLYTPNWHSYSCLIFMFIFTQVSLSLPLSLVQLASFIKIDRKS